MRTDDNQTLLHYQFLIVVAQLLSNLAHILDLDAFRHEQTQRTSAFWGRDTSFSRNLMSPVWRLQL